MPRSRAMARQVAESRPPERRTTARSAVVMGISFDGGAGNWRAASAAGRVAPQDLVKLELEAHRQAVAEDPVGQGRGVEPVLDRGEQDRAAVGIVHGGYIAT